MLTAQDATHAKLGIGTYTFMWSIGFEGARPKAPMSAFQLLRRACELGVHVVQYCPNLPLDRLGDTELEQLIDQARQWEIELEIGTRGVDSANLLPQLRLARRTGARLLRCTSDSASGAPLTPAELERGIRNILPALQDFNIRLAVENAQIPARDMAAVIEQIGSPLVGITLDTVNSLAVPEGTREVVRILAPYVFCLHIKDFQAKRQWHSMGFVVEGRPAGRGQLNVTLLLTELQQAGAAPHTAILELWPPEQSSLPDTITLEQAWAEESIQYLRRYIGR